MATKHAGKTAMLAQVNAGIFGFAVDSISDASEWEFFCECGRPICHELVMLPLDAYTAIRDGRQSVLAPGHQPSQLERARRLGEEARALRAQAAHQVRRAQKNRERGS